MTGAANKIGLWAIFGKIALYESFKSHVLAEYNIEQYFSVKFRIWIEVSIHF
jgi:hypothetical protein